MLFNSFEFLLFFPTLCILYFINTRFIKKNVVSQFLLLAASLFFYACWNPAYLCLILLSVVITYSSGILMEKFTEHKVLILVFSLVINLGILFFFKYYNFIADSIDWISNKAGLDFSTHKFNVLLPVGISFYTFQALGYSMDVYKGKIKAEKNFVTYALFVTFFPQLVAGPIERTENLLPQFKADYEFDYDRVTGGLKLAAWGFFKKIIVADTLAIYVNGVYNNLTAATGSAIILATFLFAFQIMCDFSGYSDIAIGVSQVLGFKLMKNFNRPYFSKSISEFWRRWHISLSTWFKDYLYIPMGGNRCSKPRRFFNLFVTFLVSGIWHGAAWHFVIWGVLHGIYQIIEILTQPLRNKLLLLCKLAQKDETSKTGIKVKRGWQFIQVAITFILVCIAWIFFRANNLKDCALAFEKIIHFPGEVIAAIGSISEVGAKEAVRSLFNLYYDSTGFALTELIEAFGLIIILFIVDMITRKEEGLTVIRRQHFIVRWILYFAIIAAILFLSKSGKSEFIYFQF